MHDHPSKTDTLHVYRNLNQSLLLHPFQNNTHKKPPLGLFPQTFKHKNDRDGSQEWAVGEHLALRRFVRVLRILPPWQIFNYALVASNTKDARRSPAWAWFRDRKQGMEWLFSISFVRHASYTLSQHHGLQALCTCKTTFWSIQYIHKGVDRGARGGAEATLRQKHSI